MTEFEREQWFYIVLWVVLLIVICYISTGCVSTQNQPSAEGGIVGGFKSIITSSAEVSSKSGLLFSLSGLGIIGSLFAIGMGAGKIGYAGLFACIGGTVYAITVDQYAWLIAIAGMIAGIVLIIHGWRKNQQDKRSIVEGIQNGKYYLRDIGVLSEEAKKVFNSRVGSHLTPNMESIVKKWKRKYCNDGKQTEANGVQMHHDGAPEVQD